MVEVACALLVIATCAHSREVRGLASVLLGCALVTYLTVRVIGMLFGWLS